jgi:hypothetical protein
LSAGTIPLLLAYVEKQARKQNKRIINKKIYRKRRALTTTHGDA